jgi:hypothetical protein
MHHHAQLIFVFEISFVDEGKVIEEITDRMRKIAHVPIQTWKGWNPNDLLGHFF